MRVVAADRYRAVVTGRELGQRALGDDTPAIDDRHLIADLLDLVEQVRGENDRPPLGDPGANERTKLLDSARIEAVGRLVQDQHLGIGEQAAGNPEPLAHALRVGADAIVGAVREADPFEHGIDTHVCLRLARGGRDPEVLSPAQMLVEAGLLDDRADTGQRS